MKQFFFLYLFLILGILSGRYAYADYYQGTHQACCNIPTYAYVESGVISEQTMFGIMQSQWMSGDPNSYYESHPSNESTPNTLLTVIMNRYTTATGAYNGLGEYRWDWYAGDPTCPEGETYNYDIQACEAPPKNCPTGSSRQTSLSMPPTGAGTVCIAGCQAQINNVVLGYPNGDITFTIFHTGQECSPADEIDFTPLDNQTSANEQCMTDANGNTYCFDDSPQNCGTFNGQEVCLDDIPEGSCTYLPGGSFICVDDTPPVNTDGTEMEKTADMTRNDAPTGDTTNNDYKTYNYYGSGDFTPSPLPTPGSYSDAALSDIADSLENIEGKDVCTDNPNSLMCQTPGSFSGGGYTDQYTSGTETYTSVFSDFVTRMDTAPISSAATNFFTITITASCPVWIIPATWIFPSMAIDMQCSPVMETIWPFIYGTLLLTASFIAFRWAVL